MDTKYDVFISYSNKDKTVADAICHMLEQYGIPCWIAPRDVRPGERYALEIIHGIKSCRLMVLVYTSSSNESQHVANEVDRAFNEEKTIIPFLVDETPMNEEFCYYLGRKHWLVAYPRYVDKLDKLAQVVANTLGTELKSVIENTNDVHLKQEEKQQEKKIGDVQVHIEVDADCNMFSFSNFMQQLRAGEDNVVRMKPGKYKLEFVSTEFPDVDCSLVYSLISGIECDFMEITLISQVEEARQKGNRQKKEVLQKLIDALRRKAEETERLKQNGLDNLMLEPINQNGKYGYADDLGNVIIPCQWNWAESFSEGLAQVKDNRWKSGYINKLGKVVIPCQWKKAGCFSEGLAAVQDRNGKWGYIDKGGEGDYSLPMGICMDIRQWLWFSPR